MVNVFVTVSDFAVSHASVPAATPTTTRTIASTNAKTFFFTLGSSFLQVSMGVLQQAVTLTRPACRVDLLEACLS